MKISAYIKRIGVATLVLGVAVGCATQPEQQADACEGISPDVQNAIDEARSVNADAREMGADWRGARKIINQAEAAGAECEDDRAMRLAREARMMAQESISAYRDMQEQEMAAEEEQEMPQERQYTVERGDTLWGISGSSAGYNDPYQWPLIYRNNEDKIEDADLIYPGQNFMIEADPSASAVDAAIDHARNRGEWELGVTETSDLEYLSGN
jgi:hypothetical protein